MREIRCKGTIKNKHGTTRPCNHLLMKGKVEEIEIKCSNCGHTQIVSRTITDKQAAELINGAWSE